MPRTKLSLHHTSYWILKYSVILEQNGIEIVLLRSVCVCVRACVFALYIL